MKDFTKYTGIKVPQSTKNAIIPGTNCEIMFRHAEELSGLQNINLGFFLIEQGDDFATDEQFMLLRGRLRRVLTPIEEIQARIVKLGVIYFKYGDRKYKFIAQKRIVNDYNILSVPAKDINGKEVIIYDIDAKCDRPLREQEVADYAIVNYLGLPLRQGMVIANSAGHNWVWRKWIKNIEQDPDYDGFEANSFQNVNNLPADVIKDWRKMEKENPGKFKRFIMNSDDDYEREGSYWSVSLNALRGKKPPQIGVVPFDPRYCVHTAWDVGYTNCIWVLQVVGRYKFYLRYYESQGEGIDRLSDMVIKEWSKDYGYYYGKHFGPWDIDNPAHKATEGKTIRTIAAEHGLIFTSLPMDKDVNNSIDKANADMPLCWFDSKGCDIGLDALEWFHVKKNERMSQDGRPYFINMPEKDWSEHCAKAFIISNQGIPFIAQGTNKVTHEQIVKWQEKYGYA
jgi:hypothetical protein